MTTAAQLARNTGFLFGGEILSRALSFVFILSLARALGDVEFGKYSFAFAIASVFLIFSDFGLSTLMVREIAKNRNLASQYLSKVFSLKLALLLAFSAALLIAITATATAQETVQIVGIVMIAMFFNLLTEPFRNIFLAFERQEYYAGLAVFERSISTIGGLAILFATHNLISVLWVFVASYSITFVVSAGLVFTRFARFGLDGNVLSWVDLLKRSWPFWFSLFFMAVYYRVDTIMLSAMTNYAVVGWYNAAYRPVEALSFIPIMVVAAVFPAMSRFHLESTHLLKVLYGKVFYYMLVIAVPLAVGTTLLAGSIISTLYTPEFQPAIIALQLLIWSELFIFLNYVVGFLLNATDKQHLFTLATAFYLLVNVVLNYLFIPLYGHAGAAGVTVVTQIIGFATLHYFAAKHGYAIDLPRLLLKPAAAALVMAAVLLLLPPLNVLVLVAAGIITYSATLVMLKGVGEEEVRLMKKLLPFARGKE